MATFTGVVVLDTGFPVNSSGYVGVRTYTSGAWGNTTATSAENQWLPPLVNRGSESEGDNCLTFNTSGNTDNVGMTLTSFPTDIDSMTEIRLKYSTTGLTDRPITDDSVTLDARIMASDYTTVIAAANSSGDYQVMDSYNGSTWSTVGGATGPAYGKEITFGWVDTSTSIDWTTAILDIRWSDSRNMGADGHALDLAEHEIVGTYTTAGTSGSGSPTMSRHTASGSGSTADPPTSGSGAPTLQRHTGAGSGSSGTSGSSATTLQRHTPAGSGSTIASGSSATTLVRHTPAGSGSTGAEGSSATTLVRHTATGSGATVAPPTSGSGAPVLQRHTAAGSGSAGAEGSGSPTLVRATAAGSGSTTGIEGTSATTLSRHTAAGSGSTATSGSGDGQLARHTATGAGTSTPPGGSGTGDLQLVRHSGSGAGSTGATGSSATTLQRHTGSGAGSTATSGSGAPTLSRVTGAGSGSTATSGTSATTLVRHTAAGSGSTGTSGSGAPTLSRHTAAGSGSTAVGGVTSYDYDFEAWSDTSTFSDNVTSGWNYAGATDWNVDTVNSVKIIVPSDAAEAWLTADLGIDDAEASAWFHSHQFSGLGGAVARFLDSDNFLMAEAVKNDGLKLYQRQSGTWTQLGSTYSYSFPEDASYRIDLIVDGNDVTVKLDGTTRITHTLAGTETFGQEYGVYVNTYSYIDRMVGGPLSTAVTGTSATTLVRATGAGSGSTGTSGSGSPSLTRVSAAGSGSTTGIEGTGSGVLSRHTATGAGTTAAPSTSGSGAPTLNRHTATGAGSTTGPVSGTGAPVLSRHTAAGAGSTGTSGSAAPTLARHTAAGSGAAWTGVAGSGAGTLAARTASGVGSTGTSGAGDLQLVRHSAVGTDAITEGSGALGRPVREALGYGYCRGKPMTRLEANTQGPGVGEFPPFEGTWLSKLR